MHFTKNIVLEVLNSYRGSNYLDETDGRKYRWVQLLPEQDEPMYEDMLYISRLSRAIRHSMDHPGKYNYICIRDCFTDDDDAEFLKGMVILNEKRDIS